ncbi:MAG: GNAT family N-acetyltransferase [Comamonadaceae bacterium]
MIETERTSLLLLQAENSHLVQAYHRVNREHLAPWEPERGDDFFTDESFVKLGEASNLAFLAGTALKFIAVHRASQQMVAGCSFTNIVRGPLLGCNMGFSVAKEFEGQGLMQEVATVAIHHMFDVMGLHRIMANHLPSNVRSERLLRRLGFEREGYAKSYLKIAGRWQDMVLNSLINPNG